MAIQLQGNSGIISEVDTSFRASRNSLRPIDQGALGHYRLSTTIPLVATQVAGGTLFSFRWADPTRFCVITFLRMEVLQTSAATATIFPGFQALIARGYTVADSGGTPIVLTVNSMKRRTSMGSTLVSDIRKSAVAGGLTVGTRTLDGDPFFEMNSNQTVTTPNAVTYMKVLDCSNSSEHPVVLAANEGLIIRGPTTAFGAAGSSVLTLGIAWAEVTAY